MSRIHARHKRDAARRSAAALALLIALLLLPAVSTAAGTPTIGWWVIAAGGGRAQAGVYSLDFTIGQPVAGVAENPPYQVCSGFWQCASAWWTSFFPVIMRNGH